MALRAVIPAEQQRRVSRPEPVPLIQPTAVSSRPAFPENDPLFLDLIRSLRAFHLLLGSARLYDRQHPRLLQILDGGYESLRAIVASMNGLEIRVERSGLVVPKLSEAPLPDARGDLYDLAKDLQRAGIYNLVFAPKFHVGELDTLAQLAKATLLESGQPTKQEALAWWPAKLREHRVEGIAINAETQRKVDTVLASLIAALVAYGGHSPREALDTPIEIPQLGDLEATLHLLARLTPPLEAARNISPEEAARSIHGAMEEASRETVRLLLSAVTQYPPRDGERPQPYLLRLSESLIFEFLGPEFSGGSLTAPGLRPMFHRLAEVLVNAGGYSGPHASAHLSSFAATWANDTHREKLIEKFWLELPPREKSAVLRGADVWCVPIVALKQNLGQLAASGADAPRREARNILLNYARRLDSTDAATRRAVAAGLNELASILESLWPNQIPEDLSHGTLKALEKETTPQTAALLAAFLENLGRVAVTRGDYAGFESILDALEKEPHDVAHDHISALAHRLVAQDRWLLLVDASLANRALDPVLPRRFDHVQIDQR